MNNTKYPQHYIVVTLAEIEQLAKDPQQVDKEKSQWAIFSSLPSRVHAEQREKGKFYALWADIDTQQVRLTFADIVSRTIDAIPDADFIGYTSHGATERNQKARIIIFLSEPVSGKQFVIMQKILNDKLKTVGILPDRASERAGQVCYLPNRGEFYDYHIERYSGALDPSQWADAIKQEQQRLKDKETALQRRMDNARRKATERMKTGCKSPIDAYNHEYRIELLFDRYGYTQRGNRWLSPNSESGVPGVTCNEQKWFSTHGSDAAIGIPIRNGTMGDAFDLFTYYEHHNDRNAALTAAGNMFTVDGLTISQHNKNKKVAEGGDKNELNIQNTTSSQLEDNSGNKTPNRVVLLSAADIRPQPIGWIWSGWLASGKLHILAGAAGTGKSTLAFGLASSISTAGRWPDGTLAENGRVAIWSGEDDPADTIVPRLLACGANLDNIMIISGIAGEDPRPFDPATDMTALRTTLHGQNIHLLIVDPVVSAVAGDSHKNTEVRRALQPLVDLAASIDCAVLGISHFTKGSTGKDPIDRVTGSLAFGALARVVMVAAKLPEDEHNGARLLARAKSNIGPDSGGVLYNLEQVAIPGHPEIMNTCVTWGKLVAGTARDLLAQAEKNDGEKKSATDEAREWLEDLLSAGAMKAGAVTSEARQAGITEKALRRAREKLGVKPEKKGFGGGWWWELPTNNENTKMPFIYPTQKEGTLDVFGENKKMPHFLKDDQDAPKNCSGTFGASSTNDSVGSCSRA